MAEPIDLDAERHYRTPGFKSHQTRVDILKALPSADEDADAPVAELIRRLLMAADQLQALA